MCGLGRSWFDQVWRLCLLVSLVVGSVERVLGGHRRPLGRGKMGSRV